MIPFSLIENVYLCGRIINSINDYLKANGLKEI